MTVRTFGRLACRVHEGPVGAPILVLLHGRGASAADLESLGPEVAPDFHHVCPDAPRPWPADGPAIGLCWYDRGPDQAAEIAESRALLIETLAAAREALGSESIALLGFSQGALMSLDTGLRPGSGVSLVVALSGYLFEDVGDAGSPPTLIAHGTADDVVPVQRGREARDRLLARGVTVTYHEYPIDHTISPAVVETVRAFIGNAMPAPRV